ncbi:uncharacterized protein THITE_47736 [Thermothielavioides terrestris NRRL 8126]|uniref:Zn(2)-C6 fungal-type domain-containing protein n=1 Tax=Thermothielavioides terrestris (strain ATCC 38088 / NRRL 8126) TaxID=578455 RepID=G2QX56_THETT|nr:uncharacterized protein THITE_47736 [Thermothielavioides terrestris NRRL 8126]AEO64823.1 hypothetical protein THITE_47736 [Thermothielavioides terrestris NRRL 8126]
MESPTSSTPRTRTYACSLCARRKVRCDKTDPCSNCAKAQAKCVYVAPPLARPRKRPADHELRSRLDEYEALLAKHGIDFGPPSHVWIQSGLEQLVPAPDASERATPTAPSTKLQADLAEERPELRHPPIQTFAGNGLTPFPQSSRGTNGSPLQSLFQSRASLPDVRQLHPEPIHIFKLWHIFIDKVNPLTKIVHVPTLQQRILDVIFDLSAIQQPLQAMMFAIYTLTITTLSAEECDKLFGETRSVLLQRYKTATLQSLMAADLFVTRDLEVLQALTLFLLADPLSDLTCTLAAVAVRLALQMGEQEHDVPKLSVFEREMRIRLFWQLRRLDACVQPKTATASHPYIRCAFGDMRLPLNVNDSELHLDMTEFPLEHTGPTEMLFVLLRYETIHWLRTSAIVAQIFKSPRDSRVPALKEKAVAELWKVLQEKYLNRCDMRIPLHALSVLTTKLAIARIRFKASHPRLGLAHLPEIQEEHDLIFETGLQLLELGHEIQHHPHFAPPLLWRMTTHSRPSADAYIYVISELRRRCSGDRVADAWRVVERLFDEHLELTAGADNHRQFYLAFGDLTLEAWDARRAELFDSEMEREAAPEPPFIQRLRATRAQRELADASISLADASVDCHVNTEAEVGWENWSDVFQLV